MSKAKPRKSPAVPAVVAPPAAALRPRPSKIVGLLDMMNDTSISGWAIDTSAPHQPFQLRVSIDDVVTGVIGCGLPRNDVGALNLPSANVGFIYEIPARYQDGTRHVLKLSEIDASPIVLSSRTGMVMPELHFCLTGKIRFEGVLDGVIDGLIRGWAVKIDERAKTKTGGLRILVTEAGQPVAELLADEYRADVATALDADPGCGFAFSPSFELRHGRRATLRFYVMPGRYELQGSPVEIAFPDGSERERLNALIARADELFSYAYHLRRELKAALPAPRYFLNDYPRWAAKSMPLALPRAVARYGALARQDQLVSVICPVYRPELADFLQAVDSVRAQTYGFWELLLVDDGSADPTLSAVMERLAQSDSRIRLIVQPRNMGIAAASNAAIAVALGVFIAFLDHDDRLEPCALEVMLCAQAATGARLLYSDEDKIDRSGMLSEPHFKPDFNYRYLLEVNYICHFVLMELSLSREVGLIDPRFDAAQDHEFLLRITERVPPAQIQHVPEVLYHWRKSATSTAAASGAKPDAASAGEAAVAAHLQRRKLSAKVTRRGSLTCYRTSWLPAASVKRVARVSILIPFRDHIELTAACVAAIRKHTADVNYEIILLDNWSSSPEAELFCTRQANLAATSVIRIAEPFNYSRINNIGAGRACHDFILFLNNDVIVSQPDWLRVMLNEMLIDPRVGAVGAKLLYPNRTVQHAGVVLGVGGIADHAFRGLPADAAGYMMHAMAAQQISAVTGACMLVRKAAFDAVGGFDEAELPVAFNDVDLCLKLRGAGWKIMFAPDAVAEHRESISRGDDFDAPKIGRFMLENEVMHRRYEGELEIDPFYSPHFSRDSGVYRELRILLPEEIKAESRPEVAIT